MVAYDKTETEVASIAFFAFVRDSMEVDSKYWYTWLRGEESGMEIGGAEASKSGKHLLTVTILGLVLCLASAFAAALSGLGSRWNLWPFRTGFSILAFAAVGGIASSLVCLPCLIAGIRRRLWRNSILSCAGLLLGLTVFGVPFSWYIAARHLPMIHDITTDTVNPPEFVAVLPLRRNAPNPAGYGGPEVAAGQREAYYDIKPLILDVPGSKAFDRARTAARRMGWDIVSANKQELRMEATDMTFWFGFKDDIAVRITTYDDRSRIDVRSVSRVGLSDAGTNARRIRRYLETIKEIS